MERKNRLFLTGAFVLGTGVLLAEMAKPQEVHSLPIESPTPTTTLPSADILDSMDMTSIIANNLNNPTATPFIDLSPTSTPEIPFGEHQCRLPLNRPFTLTMGFLTQRTEDEKDGGGLMFREGIPVRHLGVDFGGVEEGSPIFNICDSELIYAGSGRTKEQEEKEKDGGQNLGNVVVVRDVPSGNYFLFAHLNKVTDKLPGEKILAGEIIGEVGHSGNWTTHLHLMIFTPYGWSLWEEGTKAFYGGDYSQTLTSYYYNLETSSDKDIAKRLVDPSIFLFQLTGEKIWKNPS